MPATEGNGLAMRAGVFLAAYARRFEVTLAVLPVAEADPSPGVSDFVRQQARRVETLPLGALLHPHYRLIAGLRDPVERLYLAPLAGAGPAARHSILDLDEDDGATQRAIGSLHALNGEADAADAAVQEASKLDRLRRDFLPRFDLILLAAPGEAAALQEEFRDARIAVVANALRASGKAPVSPASAKSIDYLMVGNFGYYPNADGARFFCREVLPLIRQAGGPRHVGLVGQRPGEKVRALATLPDVAVHAGPADLVPFYADSAVAVVPVRAGGGSRIKILEAFAQGLPVVSTRIGAAGLEAADGRHLLIADGSEDFAAAALRLRRDPALAAALAAEGQALLERRYGFENAVAGILSLVDSLARI